MFANWGGRRVGVHRVELVGPGGAVLPTLDALLSLELGAAATTTAAAQMSARDTLPRCVTCFSGGGGTPTPTHTLLYCWSYCFLLTSTRIWIFCSRRDLGLPTSFGIRYQTHLSSFFIHSHSTSRAACNNKQIILN